MVVFAVSIPPHPNPLPQGEGTPNAARRLIRRVWQVETRPTILPLPAGEGRGEGEQDVHQSVPNPVTKLPCHLTRHSGHGDVRAGRIRARAGPLAGELPD